MTDTIKTNDVKKPDDEQTRCSSHCSGADTECDHCGVIVAIRTFTNGMNVCDDCYADITDYSCDFCGELACKCDWI